MSSADSRFLSRIACVARAVLIPVTAAGLTVGIAVGAEATRIPQPTALSNVVSKVSPTYPPVAKQLRLSGDVEVDVVISEEGSVEDAKVVKGNAVFTATTVDAVKRWKFKPIELDGKAARVLTTLTFSFKSTN